MHVNINKKMCDFSPANLSFVHLSRAPDTEPKRVRGKLFLPGNSKIPKEMGKEGSRAQVFHKR